MKTLPVIALMRPHQWVKNFFVVAPLVFTPHAFTLENMQLVALGFVLFSLLASAVYVLNDMVDITADQAHPVKKHRALASGAVSFPVAFFLLVVLLALAFTGSFLCLPPLWSSILLLYFFMNILYSKGLKHVPLLDVSLIAAGFVLRVLAGCVLLAVLPSAWILLATLFLSLFLAFGKRLDDLTKGTTQGRKSLDGYNEPFIHAAMLLLGTAAVMTYTLWTMDTQVMAHLGTSYIFATTPFVVLGFLRYLQVCLVEGRGGSPTKIALTDKGIVLILLGWLCTFSFLVYGG